MIFRNIWIYKKENIKNKTDFFILNLIKYLVDKNMNKMVIDLIFLNNLNIKIENN